MIAARSISTWSDVSSYTLPSISINTQHCCRRSYKPTFKILPQLDLLVSWTITFVAASLVSYQSCSKPRRSIHGHSELCHTLLICKCSSLTTSNLLSVIILLPSPSMLSDEVSAPACHPVYSVLLYFSKYFFTDFGPPVLFLLLSGHSLTCSLISWVFERLGKPMVGVLKKVQPVLYLAALMWRSRGYSSVSREWTLEIHHASLAN
jgi:hypothetical protein